jgi:trehalose 6-phosphate phosphatase
MTTQRTDAAHGHPPAPTPAATPAPQAGPPPEALDGVALFLDVDGSLLDLRPVPEAVFAPLSLLRLLLHVQLRLDGALAVVSGRTVDDLDRIFHPLRLPCAGVHGVERRHADGVVHRLAVDRTVLDAARPALERFAHAHPGALVEDKGAALALHTRRAPAATDAALALVEELAVASGGAFRAMPGKCVAELRPAKAHKGEALAAFMADPRFAGRRPVAVGDDVTDGDAFREARVRGGIAIAVGASAPDADHRLDGPSACRAWLARASGFEARSRPR